MVGNILGLNGSISKKHYIKNDLDQNVNNSWLREVALEIS